MTISMHRASVGVFVQFLGTLLELLDRAAAHAQAKGIEPSVLLKTRLYPNMYSLSQQVGEATRHAILACGLLADVTPPVFPDSEPDITELKARVATAIRFVKSLTPDQLDGTAKKPIVFTFRSGKQRHFTGESLLLTFSVPQCIFHVTTAYDILRHCGVELVKNDFLGTPYQSPEG
jgi:uncharacterized protein